MGGVALWLCLVAGGAVAEEAHPVGASERDFVDPRLEGFPFPDLSALEPAVAEQLQDIEVLLRSLDPAKELRTSGGIFADAGQIYHAYELEAAAVACYLNAEILLPGDHRWPYLRAVLLQKAGDLAGAANAYRVALLGLDEHVPSLVRLAEVRQAQGRLDEAKELLTRALRIKPSSAAAAAGLGEIALAERSYEEAVRRLTEVLEQVPGANRYRYPLALAYRGLGDRDAAAKHLALRGEVGLQPADPLLEGLEDLKRGERVYLLRGRRAFGAGRYPEAAEAFAAAVEARPDSARARINLASALALSGSRDQAVEELNRALRLEPDNLTARFNLGRLMLEAGRTELAIPQLRFVVEKNPEDLRATTSLAEAYRSTGKLEAALRWYAKAVELDPGQEAARLEEASVLVALERYREATARLETAHELMPREGRLMMALARLLAASPDPSVRDGERALELAQQVYQVAKTVASAELLAMALAETGRCEQAAEWQQGVVEAAEKAGLESVAARRETLRHYLESRPCRPPVRSAAR